MRGLTALMVRSSIGWMRRAAVALVWAAAASAAPSSLIGQSAPDFALPPALNGDNVRLSEYHGQPVLLLFWSSNCGTCARQLAVMERLYETYHSSGLVVLGVSVDDDAQRAERFAREHRTRFPLLLDSDKAVGRDYKIDRLPTTVLIDRSGNIRYLNDDDRANDRSYITQIRTLLDDEGVSAER
jgi:peroxiredoxin